MAVSIQGAEGRVPITVLDIQGDLDYSNYLEVIQVVRSAYGTGARYLLIDLGGVPFMGSSGLVALHSAALIMAGLEPPDPENGWQSFHALGDEVSEEIQARVKLVNPQPRVDQMLERTGLKRYFAIHAERSEAVAAF
jgi:anti-anti-sigma regulatory factor